MRVKGSTPVGHAEDRWMLELCLEGQSRPKVPETDIPRR
jgi:hypothetical protein